MVDLNNVIQLATAAIVAYNLRETRKVHNVVNSRATAQDERIEQLTAKMTDEDVSVPPSRPPATDVTGNN